MREPAASQIIAGKYRVESLIGHGGMGSVWRARHLTLDMPVAIKFMGPHAASDAESRQRFDREARALATLRTPHIVQVLDHGVDDDVPYIVMEYLEGEDLSSRLGQRKRLPLDQTSRILAQVARGLRRAHEAGITHRDLKPSNIFIARIDDEEVVKVLDFGVAKLGAAGLLDDSQLTKAGTLLGSPGYMSPEQARGKEVDFRSDLWALAVIVFRAVTGVKPFQGESIAEIVIKLCIEPRPVATRLSPDLPPAMDRFFERAFAQNPEERFPSAADMATAFAQMLGQPMAEMSRSGPSPITGASPAVLDAPAQAAQTAHAAQTAQAAQSAPAAAPAPAAVTPYPSAPAPAAISVTPAPLYNLPPASPPGFRAPSGVYIPPPPPPSAAALREPTPTPASFAGFAPSGHDTGGSPSVGPPPASAAPASHPGAPLRPPSPDLGAPALQAPRPPGPDAPDAPTPTGMRLLPRPTLILSAPQPPPSTPRLPSLPSIRSLDPKILAFAAAGAAVLAIFFSLAIAGLKRRHATVSEGRPDERERAPIAAPSSEPPPALATEPPPAPSATAEPTATEPTATAQPSSEPATAPGVEPTAAPSAEPTLTAGDAPPPTSPSATAPPPGVTNPTARPTGKIPTAPTGSTKKKGPKPNFGY